MFTEKPADRRAVSGTTCQDAKEGLEYGAVAKQKVVEFRVLERQFENYYDEAVEGAVTGELLVAEMRQIILHGWFCPSRLLHANW